MSDTFAMIEQPSSPDVPSANDLERLPINFCCGGSIDFLFPDNEPTHSNGGSLTCPPVIVRFDGPITARLEFPECNLTDGSLLFDLHSTRGHLKPSQFSTSFVPTDYGIVQAVSQTLFPKEEAQNELGTTGNIIAKLSRLSIYSGTVNFSPEKIPPPPGVQLGTLLVYLPVRKWIQSIVRITHSSDNANYTWGGIINDAGITKVNQLEWVAFVKDCSYEILKKTSGPVCVLKYDLLKNDFSGCTIRPLTSPLNPKSFPVFSKVNAMISENPSFMPNGGFLGFVCENAYGHTSKCKEFLPGTLKGTDAIMWSVFNNLKLEPAMRPVMLKTGNIAIDYVNYCRRHIEPAPGDLLPTPSDDSDELNDIDEKALLADSLDNITVVDLSYGGEPIGSFLANDGWAFEKVVFLNEEYLSKAAGETAVVYTEAEEDEGGRRGSLQQLESVLVVVGKVGPWEGGSRMIIEEDDNGDEMEL